MAIPLLLESQDILPQLEALAAAGNYDVGFFRMSAMQPVRLSSQTMVDIQLVLLKRDRFLLLFSSRLSEISSYAS